MGGEGNFYGGDFVIIKNNLYLKFRWVGTTYNQVNVERKSCTRSCTAERGKEGESISSQPKEDSAQESHMTDDSRAHHQVSRDSTKKRWRKKSSKT